MPMKVGDKIKELRKNRGLQQKKLAAVLEVGQATISQWESGRQEPNPTQRARLCKYFGIGLAELFEDFEIKKFSDSIIPIQKIPIISWVSANHFGDASDPFPPGQSEEWIHTTARGKRMFALKIKNDCMEPEFREGETIIVDPDIEPSSGDYVVVRDNKNDEATFKQLKKYGKKIILHPLNPKYQDIELDHDERYVIVGKVVGKDKKY